jgi:DUF438 domain-containing protein
METPIHWDSALIAEHEKIERGMEVLKSNLEKIEAGSHDPVQTARAVDFLLEFGDRIHNLKEEKYLFPRLNQRGIPSEGGPIGCMLQEHETERTLLAEMQGILPTLAEASPEARKSFVQKGLEYLQVRANHIWKENDVLYKMGRQVLSAADCEELLAGFHQIDNEFYGENASEIYQSMLAEVEQGSQRKRMIENLSHHQIDRIMEVLPVEVTFVDAKDTVAYFNRLDREKIFTRTRSAIGRKVGKCHPSDSVSRVLEIVEGFRSKTLDKADFWIDFGGKKVMIRYFPVYDNDEAETYMGVVEVTQDITWLQSIKGQKRLLQE